MMKYQLLFLLLCSINTINAQIGINTPFPFHLFHIDGAKDNNLVPTEQQILNDVVITSEGNVGVGTLTPKTKVDVRSSDQKGIIGLGTSIQTAVEAGAGAIRYKAGNIVQYSDGAKWHDLPMSLPPKTLILANKSSNQSFTNNSTTAVKEWTIIKDSQSNFNAASGVFTAARDGFYMVSFNILLANENIARNSRIETIIESNTSLNNIQTYKNVNSYPAWDVSTVNNIVGGNCNAIFKLSAGNTIQFKVYHNLGSSRNIDTGNNGTNNSVSIYEL